MCVYRAYNFDENLFEHAQFKRHRRRRLVQHHWQERGKLLHARIARRKQKDAIFQDGGANVFELQDRAALAHGNAKLETTRRRREDFAQVARHDCE